MPDLILRLSRDDAEALRTVLRDNPRLSHLARDLDESLSAGSSGADQLTFENVARPDAY